MTEVSSSELKPQSSKTKKKRRPKDSRSRAAMTSRPSHVTRKTSPGCVSSTSGAVTSATSSSAEFSSTSNCDDVTTATPASSCDSFKSPLAAVARASNESLSAAHAHRASTPRPHRARSQPRHDVMMMTSPTRHNTPLQPSSSPAVHLHQLSHDPRDVTRCSQDSTSTC